MRSLGELQRAVVDAVRGHGADGDEAPRYVLPSHRGLDAAARLAIYRDQFILRHHANLRDDFPTLLWALGEERFRDLVAHYLRDCPPDGWNLRRLGARLPQALFRDAEAERLLFDAACLDWAVMETYDAPDAGVLDLDALSRAPEDAWPSARIVLNPSLRLLRLTHPIHLVRDAVMRGETPPRPAPEATAVVVWRDAAFVPRSLAIEPVAFDLLAALAEGAALGSACEAVARAEPARGDELDARVGAWFQQWTGNGWIDAVRLGA
jgi:hypothetical protein